MISIQHMVIKKIEHEQLIRQYKKYMKEMGDCKVGEVRVIKTPKALTDGEVTAFVEYTFGGIYGERQFNVVIGENFNWIDINAIDKLAQESASQCYADLRSVM
jgi:hypothetical protein